MKKIKILFTAGICMLTYSFASAQNKKQNTLQDEAMQAIAASNAIYFESFVKNDSSIFINRYAKDACIFAPNAPAMCGQKAAADFFKTAYREYGLRNGKFITTAV